MTRIEVAALVFQLKVELKNRIYARCERAGNGFCSDMLLVTGLSKDAINSVPKRPIVGCRSVNFCHL
jgi:hypothetical protein